MISLFYITMTLFILICAILILLILIQKGRGGGLASAFGGAGGQTAFGSKTGDVLTVATSTIFGLFVVFAVLLNLIANRIDAARGGTANAPTQTNQPVMPNSPQSSLPKAPVGDPGAAAAGQAKNDAMPATAPPKMMPAMSVPTTMPAAMQATSVPTTLPTTLP